MRCCIGKLFRDGRITQAQHETAQRWAALSRAYRAVVSGSYDDGEQIGRDRLSAHERAVIRRYRMLAPVIGRVERDIIEGRGRSPRSLLELASVRRVLDEIRARWSEAG